jgi:hypothetical protein
MLPASIPVKARKSIGKIRGPAALRATQKERVFWLLVASPGFGGHYATKQCCQPALYSTSMTGNIYFSKGEIMKLDRVI